MLGLRRVVEVLLAIGQGEASTQHCPSCGAFGTGTVSTMSDPRDVIHGGETQLQPGRVLDLVRTL